MGGTIVLPNFTYCSFKKNLQKIGCQLNINPGYNEALMKSCPLLFEYMSFVEKVRQNQKIMDIQKAVELAVEECIRDDILREFLKKNRKQVIAVSIFVYDEELHKEVIREEAWESGREAERIALIKKKLDKINLWNRLRMRWKKR